jgi:pSer/pThr/pTyr-binding forkhead associated (FHA) protein
MTSCPNCGASVAAESNFCPQCGEKLRLHSGDTTRVIPIVTEDARDNLDLSSEQQTAVDALPKGSALLIVQRGPDAGARYLLDSEAAVAGRHPDCDIFLDDVTVSRHHVRFTRQSGQMACEDLGSLNGTYVNRALLDGAAVLRTGDEVQIGKYRLVYFESTLGLG